MFKSNKNSKEGRAGMQPVLPIELSPKNKRVRIILAVAALVLALVMFGIFFFNLLNKPAGWRNIETLNAAGNCGYEFTLQYELGRSDTSATTEYKQLQRFYTQICQDAYRIFHAEETFEGMGNLASINLNPNQPVTVDPALYCALEQIKASGNRTIFLANVLVEYNRIFYAESALDAQRYDPASNEEVRAYISALAAYANNPDAVSLELLGDNRVQLKVSADYSAFFQQSDLDRYLDLGWLKNAFVADYLAQRLADAGYTNGYVASYDGFTRNLDDRGNSFSQNIHDRRGMDIYLPALIQFDKPMSLVYLRDYPLLDLDRWRYAELTDGRIVSNYIDPADGMSKAATPDLLAYAEGVGCAEIALQLSPAYVCDAFSRDAVLSLTDNGIHTVWCKDKIICYTQQDAPIELQSNGREYGYQLLHQAK